VAESNVEHVVRGIREESPLLDAMIAKGQLGIVPGMYSVQSGAVRFQDMVCGSAG